MTLLQQTVGGKLKHPAGRRFQRGSSIVEGVISMLLVCLVLFGLLQIFLLYTTQEFTDYTAFRSARSLSVGYADELTVLEVRARALPVSGAVLSPAELKALRENSFTASDYTQDNGVYSYFYRLRRAIRHYMEGRRWMECEYWRGNNVYGTRLNNAFSKNTGSVTSDLTFSKYPLRLPFAKAFFPDNRIDITSSCELKNHAAAYLEN